MTEQAFLHGAVPEPSTDLIEVEARGPGRPSGYDREIAETICDHIAAGDTLRTICAIEGMPSKATIARWLRKDPDFAVAYRISLLNRSHALADDIIDIGRALCKDDSIRIHAGETHIKSLFKLMAQENPKVYGLEPIDPTAPEKPAQEILPPGDEAGDTAKHIPGRVVDHFPMEEQLKAWSTPTKPQDDDE